MSPGKPTMWDYDKDEVLIELVKTKRDLYDQGSPRYSDNMAKRRHWEEIGHHLDKDGPECKDRWESLRSQFRKHVNKAKPRSGHAATTSPKWKYEDQMAFLYTFMKDRSRMSTTVATQEEAHESEDETAHHDDEEEEEEETRSGHENRKGEGELPVQERPPPKKQLRPKGRKALEHNSSSSSSASATLIKYLVEKQREECAPDTTDTFFSLMAATVKKFNPGDQHFIKTKVFSLVNEMEGRYIQYQNSHGFAAFPQGICLSPAVPSPSQHSDTSTGSYTQTLHETPRYDGSDAATPQLTPSHPH
ncbi:uncharacterized protein [Panulirus ornatus]|uniref:uncharacterized protein n=1 Tax=Panulirus ornatus TaxID=150431 RepID=UPI003A8C16CD